MSFSSKKELLAPDVNGKITFINPFEAVADGTDNRASFLQSAAIDFLAGLVRSWATADFPEASTVSLAWDYATRTLTVSSGNLDIEIVWYDPTTRAAASTIVRLSAGDHILGAYTVVDALVTPDTTLVLASGVGNLVDDNVGMLGGSSTLAVQQALDDIGDPANTGTYVSTDEALRYMPLLRVAGTTLSLLGGRLRIRDGHALKWLDRDTQYVQVSDTTISITATSGAMTLTGQAGSSISFGAGSTLGMGATSLLDMGADAILQTGASAQVLLGDSSTLVFDTYGTIEFTNGYLHWSSDGSLLCDTNFVLNADGFLDLVAGANLYLRNTGAGASLGISTAGVGSELNISTAAATSPLDISTAGAGAPINIHADAAAGSLSLLRAWSAEGMVVSRLDGADYNVPFGVPLAVVDDYDTAPNSTAFLLIHNVKQHSEEAGRRTQLSFSGETVGGTLFTQAYIKANHVGILDDQLSRMQLGVAGSLGTRVWAEAESDNWIAFWGAPVLLDPDPVPTGDPLSDLKYDDSLIGTVNWGTPALTVRETRVGSSSAASLVVDNLSTSFADTERISALALRGKHGTELFSQAAFWARNRGGANDRETEAFIGVYQEASESIHPVLRFIHEGVELLAGKTLTVEGTLLVGGGSLETDLISNATAVVFGVENDSGLGFQLKGGDLSVMNYAGAAYQHIYASNAPRAMGVLQLMDPAATTKAVGMSVARLGAGQYQVTLTPAMPNADYMVFLQNMGGTSTGYAACAYNRVVGSFYVDTFDMSTGLPVDLVAADATFSVLVVTPEW